ncbi:hypothetical protein CONCODRAFT_77732 [Conidiobolus coronatus NRRL 28638]|uniref:Histidine biosynthesis trifunctional protein n=1 Tax=Conidiobolus coronatus (strain ATCC 28846 / CBS 209.66 / NRRL 28638) TaxID=796925 RepID=A0A137PC29_CONC2|nr:hypothetical protein CONCODRAFT_77732 [Conidiobolus coronatus NRRL 28638]|eukprot:KXN72546.1 hypothetical protein CONCODRAFT_77732 [Conidiobolus coronatus NRRL 28638]
MIVPIISTEDYLSPDELTNSLLILPQVIISCTLDHELELLLQYLKEDPTSQASLTVLLSPHFLDQTVSLLDLGVTKVIYKCSQPNLLQDCLNNATDFPSDRVGCYIDLDTCKDTFISNIPTLVQTFTWLGFYGENSQKTQERTEFATRLNSSQCKVYSGTWYLSIKNNISDIKELLQFGVLPVIESSNLSLAENDSAKINLGDAIVAGLVTDREDQLYTTCVVDEYEELLGLVYSSSESIKESLKIRQGVYQSRKRGLWHKGQTSGATQDLLQVNVDCDRDVLKFRVAQHREGFCHLNTWTCFGPSKGISALSRSIKKRKLEAPEGSYTHRLFSDHELLNSKLMEEAEELCEAKSAQEAAWEAADLIYFALVKCTSLGASLSDVEAHLDRRSLTITRRAGNAKPKWSKNLELQKISAIENSKLQQQQLSPSSSTNPQTESINQALANLQANSSSNAEIPPVAEARIQMQSYFLNEISANERSSLLNRPILQSKEIQSRVEPILHEVRIHGDAALLDFTAKFDRVKLEKTHLAAPFPPETMTIPDEVKKSIDLAFENVFKFHKAQYSDKTLEIETMPGVVCTRFPRPIQRVGLYVPGGSAILPSSTYMLGIPAMVAGCEEILVCTPPRSDGTIAPEVVYVANKIGASMIVMAGGAQAVAAMAYGTQTIPKVDKICGPGNQYVTCAKMIVQNDPTAMVSIDMPAGPSELLVIADSSATPKYIASDLLSQAEHGPDSQVVLVTVDLDDESVTAIEDELHRQASVLPRVDIVRESIPKSVLLRVDTIDEAIQFSNDYAPEHLIIQTDSSVSLIPRILNAGSVFLGHYSPESCGDYASGTNHTLPTYGYAKMYSGVNVDSFLKYITSQYLTKEGLNLIGDAVEILAHTEGLQAHRNAVTVRLQDIRASK